MGGRQPCFQRFQRTADLGLRDDERRKQAQHVRPRRQHEEAAGAALVDDRRSVAIEKARDIVKAIKDSKKKVQASIQGDTVRISGKDRDTLQETIALLRGHDFGLELQFTNYRSN